MPTVLLATDAEWVRNDVAAALTDPGVTLETVEDPRAVAERAVAGTFDAYLLDLQMGAMGGMALTRRLRDGMRFGEVAPGPIVMLLDRSADEFLAKRAGADAWLVKPFTSHELRLVLADVVPVLHT